MKAKQSWDGLQGVTRSRSEYALGFFGSGQLSWYGSLWKWKYVNTGERNTGRKAVWHGVKGMDKEIQENTGRKVWHGEMEIDEEIEENTEKILGKYWNKYKKKKRNTGRKA